MKPKGLLLFWTSTADHHEDDFVVAASAEEASEFHENDVGYDPGDAKSERLEVVQGSYESPSYADHKLLARLGYKKITESQPVVFAKHGRVFTPVDICYRLFLGQTKGQNGIYVIHAVGTRQFKVGLTANLEGRLRKLQTGSPFRLRAKIFVACDRPKDLEHAVHEWLEEKRASQEWFILTEKEYRELRSMIWGLTKLSAEYKVADYDCYPEIIP